MALSLGAIFYAVFGGESSVNLADEKIFEGKVLKVIEERTVPNPVGQRSNLEQELLVEVGLYGKKENKTVLNDFVPVKAGDSIYVQGQLLGEPDEVFYVLDIGRKKGLLWLAIFFTALVGVVSGKKGLYALVGLVFSFAVIFLFIIPKILGGSNPILIGLAGAVLILVVALYVSYGFNRKSLSALIGISITLLIVGLMANYSISAMHFSGFSAEEAIYLSSQTDNSLSLAGILVAGILIAVIGILDDIAVTQASTVFSLVSVSGELRGAKLFKKAMEVGKDHISAVINTLVLAYTGAALPLLLLLTLNKFPLGFVVNGEIIAEEIAQTLISSSGLVLAVPITTAVAVFLVGRNSK
ncbi:MAG: YibE/F family protein [bacterium]|nr:YibE/F family protein [bacterium]